VIFRRWAAITTIAAALEQKVWVETSSNLYPNLYTFLVGHPGVGKSRTINAAARFVRELPEFHIGATSMTMASLTDCLTESKRTVICHPDPPMEFNSMFILADELSAFMHKFEEDIIGGLTTFYDPNTPYTHHRRGKDIRIKIKRPQLSILSGTTPANLLNFMPDMAWDQGFCSRIIMVYSIEKPMNDDYFASITQDLPKEMVHDIKAINALIGQFDIDQEFRDAFNSWRKSNNPSGPTHPKLTYYNQRRREHLVKIAMVSNADRGDSLKLGKLDFDRAMLWLTEAEQFMPNIFRAGSTGVDAKAIEEIHYFIASHGKAMSEHRVIRFASDRVPLHSVTRVIEIMEKSGRIKATSVDKRTGLRMWEAQAKED
jgi:Protein of unknown function (DUF3987)